MPAPRACGAKALVISGEIGKTAHACPAWLESVTGVVMRRSTAHFGRSAASKVRIAVALVFLVLGAAGLSGLVAPQPGKAQDETEASAGGTALVLNFEGVVGPALALYVNSGIEGAAGEHDLVILEMDTPGGLDTSMREMIQTILASPVPVATFVSPGGARAASAGTYILYASHVAAMAPSTTLGAATPIQLAGGGGAPGGDQGEGGNPIDAIRDAMQDGSGEGEAEAVPASQDAPAGTGETAADETAQEGEPADDAAAEEDAGTPDDGLTAAQRKAINDAAAYIRGLAIKRGRNAEWAEQAVREAVSLDSTEAVEINVIDLVAADIPDLLDKIDGREVEIEGRGTVTLRTKDLTPVELEMTWIQQLLAVITDPNIALILMQIGVLGLIVELYNPGAVFPGVVGVVCLILGLIALNVLPVSTGALALMIAGIVFMLLELIVASGGLLAVVGVVAFGFGALFLFDTDVPQFQVSLWTVIISTGIMALAIFGAVSYALAAQRRKPASGVETIIGQIGTVTEWSGDEGHVLIDGESWKAVSEKGPLTVGQKVRALRVEGLTLWVEPA